MTAAAAATVHRWVGTSFVHAHSFAKVLFIRAKQKCITTTDTFRVTVVVAFPFSFLCSEKFSGKMKPHEPERQILAAGFKAFSPAAL